MQTVFSRNEKKYIITTEQAESLISLMAGHVEVDKYGKYWVQNLYYDTEGWDVIRTSMEKPFFKEKMRLRCYGTLENSDRVFLEFKKKYAGVVYKRRLPLLPQDCSDIRKRLSEDDSQIAKELAYYINRTGVRERMFISYYRQAFAGLHDAGLRITFDSEISYRLDDFGFNSPGVGHAILKDAILLEIKTPSNFPVWLAQLLGELGLYTSSFSKYGTCFMEVNRIA